MEWLVVLFFKLPASALSLSLGILPYSTFTGVQGPMLLFFSKVCWVARTEQYTGKFKDNFF